jgi:hypothetical protein
MFVERPPLANGKPASWAFGWNVSKENYGDRATISMHGGIKGVSSTILLFPDEHVAVIGLCNLWKPAASGIIKNATKLYFGAPDTPNVPEPGVETE